MHSLRQTAQELIVALPVKLVNILKVHIHAVPAALPQQYLYVFQKGVLYGLINGYVTDASDSTLNATLPYLTFLSPFSYRADLFGNLTPTFNLNLALSGAVGGIVVG